MKTITLLSGQTYVEEEREGGDFTLIPAHKWIEEQVAPHEIAIAFELLAENKDAARFDLFSRWLLGELQGKYGEKWPRLFEVWLNSPDAGRLIAMMEIDGIVRDSGFGEEGE